MNGQHNAAGHEPGPIPSRPSRRGNARRPLSWPDVVIVTRVMLAFVALGTFALPHPWSLAAPAMILIVIAMDGLDGFLARRAGVEDELGGVMDITADRIVEHVFWIYFAVAGLIPLWVPLVIVTRSFSVDAVRGIAATQGRTAFGPESMMTSTLSAVLVSSRFMRTIYGLAKVLAFLLLALVSVAASAHADGSAAAPTPLLQAAAAGAVWITVTLNVLRGLPVLWDGRHYLAPTLPVEAVTEGCRADAGPFPEAGRR